MRSQQRRPLGPAVLLWGVLTGCGVELPEGFEPSPEDPVPATLEIMSVRNTLALLGDVLSGPLQVRVRDARGAPVGQIEVLWRVEQGEGAFCGLSGDPCGSRLVRTVTGGDGVAMVQFRPTRFGVATLSAVVTKLEYSPAIFTVVTSGVLIRFGPTIDCDDDDDPVRFSGPDGDLPVTVEVGMRVVWEYDDRLHPGCRARVVSLTSPEGGQPIDSGEMRPGGQFEFFPTVAGVWEFHDVVSGGGGRLNVVTPRSSPE